MIGKKGIFKRYALPALAAVVTTSSAISHAADKPVKKKPNILFIITDDQFKEQFGFLGGKALTPNIDRLAKEGMYFENGFVSSSVCSPSRYTCLSGQYASRCTQEWFTKENTKEGVTRILWNVGFNGKKQPTVPRVMQSGGYKTGFIGKWHVNGTLHLVDEIKTKSDPYDPKIQKQMRKNHSIIANEIKTYGFDYADAVYGGNPNDDRSLKRTGCNVHNMEWTTKAAVDFITENKEEPWYLYFAPTLMHVPEPYESLMGDPRKSGMGILDAPITGVQPSRQSVLDRTKAAGIPERNVAATWLDDGIGAILDKVKELGLAEDTLVVYYNDNGMEYHSKGTCYQGGIRTQIMAYWPGKITPGPSKALIQNVDFGTTFFDLAGITPPEDMVLDGRSLVPVFKREKLKNWRTSIFSEIGLARSISTADWSYVAFHVPPSLQRTKEERLKEHREYYYGKMLKNHPEMEKDYPFDPDAKYYQLGMIPGGYQFERKQLKDPANTPWAPNYFDPDQLYNLKNDPTEKNNLAKSPEYKEQLKTMKKALKGYIEKVPGPYFGLD